MKKDLIYGKCELLAGLVAEKNAAYGNSWATSGRILRILYPMGVPVDAYEYMLLLVRMLDKMGRIATGGGDREDPWGDIAGYGILGSIMAEQKKRGEWA